MKDSKIEWTDHTFNPWIGCTKVGPECDHCYAESMSNRRKWAEWGLGMPRHLTGVQTWKNPHVWNRQAKDLGDRPRVFCASLADWADAEAPDEWRTRLFEVIDACRDLDWLLLTKRAGHARSYLNGLWGDCPWPHVWVGVTAGTQAAWDTNVAHLLETSASVRWVSMEPLLEEIDIDHRPTPDWLVLGDESGPGARLGNLNWHRKILRVAGDAGTQVFVKQLCDRGRKVAFEDWPVDLRIRRFPNGPRASGGTEV